MKLEHDEDDLRSIQDKVLDEIRTSSFDERELVRNVIRLTLTHARSRPEPGGELDQTRDERDNLCLTIGAMTKELAELKERLKLTDVEGGIVVICRKACVTDSSPDQVVRHLLAIIDRITSAGGNG